MRAVGVTKTSDHTDLVSGLSFHLNLFVPVKQKPCSWGVCFKEKMVKNLPAQMSGEGMGGAEIIKAGKHES